jgi:hypothetical protein
LASLQGQQTEIVRSTAEITDVFPAFIQQMVREEVRRTGGG